MATSENTTTQFTPGPWATEPTSDHGASARVMDEQEVTVALCYQQPFDTWQASDNARLIAAAPALLDALKMAAVLMRAVLTCDHCAECAYCKSHELINKELGHINAWISIAEGVK